MSILKRLMLSVAGLIVITACSSNQKNMEKLLAGKSYGGVIPCADCEGIAYSLSFYANSRYESRSMYIGENNNKFVKQGSWRAGADSTITLVPEEGDPRRLKVVGGEFLLLDREGEEVEGRLASKYMLRNLDHRPLMGGKQREENSTIDFKAHGNEPFWGLEIDRDSLISFKVVSGDSLGVSMAQVTADSSDGVLSFLSKPQEDSLNIRLHPIGCMDSMSGQVYDYRVEVNKGDEQYTGCGSFVQENTD